MIVGADSFVMLLSENFFRRFTNDEVKQLVAQASTNGGRPAREPQDHGFMYEHAI